MKYRPFGSSGFSVSALGFGCMRLPTTGESDTDVDAPQAIAMIRHAIDAGVNYVDTAWPYHGGNSEKVLGRALGDGYRQKVRIATKLPTWLIAKTADVMPLLDEQLQRLQTDFIDYYLIHNIHREWWPKIKDLELFATLTEARQAGKIGEIGFSYHDEYDLFTEVLDAYPWALCQFQYNYVNQQVQAGARGLEYAAARGVPVVVMEPLLGGCLADPPPPVRAVFDAAPDKPQTPVDWALQWLWNHPGVSTVLSGMHSMQEVTENLASAERSGVGALSPSRLDTIQAAAEAYAASRPVPCTRCGYCLPCPAGIEIPKIFAMYNGLKVFGGPNADLSRNLYRDIDPQTNAAACTECGDCIEKCPQKIDVPSRLTDAHDALAPS